MLPEKTLAWGRTRSCIRELAEYGAVRSREIGAENIFNFSIGNPSVPAPDIVNQTIMELAGTQGDSIHCYTTAAGIIPLREKVAEDINRRVGLQLNADSIYVTCGAAASLTISLRAVLNPRDQVIVMAPFFPEYRVFSEASGAEVLVAPPADDMQMDIEAVSRLISARTRAVIVNSPNNPSGAIYSEENLKALSDLLRKAEEKYGESIYLISDEPYRELVYDGKTAPCPAAYYDDCLICYSWSKSLSVPGERIGYIAVSNRMKNAGDVYASIMGAGRCLGFVNPPSMFQRVIERCLGLHVDENIYCENRNLLCDGLKKLGYEFISPEGAFYLFVKALEPDAKAFSEKAKKHELLLVPSDDFGCGGYVRIAYCVSADMIRRSMPAFEALMKDYRK